MGFAKFVFVPNKLKATAITSYIHTRQIIKQTIFLLCMVRTLRSLRPENKVKIFSEGKGRDWNLQHSAGLLEIRRECDSVLC
jgi:hypothetical protein